MLNKIFKETGNGIEFFVYLSPGAKREEISGFITEPVHAVKISIHAKPTDNQANTSLIKFLANFLKIAKSNISIKRGQKSRQKQINIINSEISYIFDKFNDI